MGKWEVGCLKVVDIALKCLLDRKLHFWHQRILLSIPRKTKASNLSHRKHKIKKKKWRGTSNLSKRHWFIIITKESSKRIYFMYLHAHNCIQWMVGPSNNSSWYSKNRSGKFLKKLLIVLLQWGVLHNGLVLPPKLISWSGNHKEIIADVSCISPSSVLILCGVWLSGW